MKRKVIFFSLIYLFLMSVNIQASEIKQIYEVSLPVVNQQRQIRGAAFEQALVEVSIRVSGNSVTPALIDLKQATRMVRQYRYKAMSQAEIDAYVEKFGSQVPPKYTLWIQFDDGKVKQLLRNNALPIWGYQRPDVLVWLAVKDGRNRYLLKKSDKSQIKDALIAEARRRGLPLVWPEYDAQDKKAVKFIDVWGEFWGPVKRASKRYPANAIILGRMNWARGSWQVNWSLLMEDQTESWQLSSLDLDVLMGNGIGVATDHISSRFAVFADSKNKGELLVRVSDLNNVKKYADASHYLSSLAPVKNVYAIEVNQFQVDFHIELIGDENDLKRIIALGKVLVPDTRAELKSAPPLKEASAPNQPESEQPASDKKTLETGHKPHESILRYRLNG